MLEHDIDQKIMRDEKKIDLLDLRMNRLLKALQEIYQNINLSAEELSLFLNNAAHFDSETWEFICEARTSLEEKFDKDLKNIRNPHKIEQSYAERKEIKNHWLFVK